MYEKYSLGDKKAKEAHNSIINTTNGYSLTLTLKPRYNSLPVHEQYNKFSLNIRKLFTDMDPYYKMIMMSFEFTKDFNIHAHLYFTTEVEDIQIFEQNFKKNKLKYEFIGTNYKLKKIDELSDELKEYPFKDIERTLKYSKLENCLFNPFHYVKRVSNMGSLRSPKVGDIDIDKYLKYINGSYIYNKDCKHCCRYNSLCSACQKII